VVEGAVEIAGGGEFLVRHPEDAVGLVVRQRGAGRRLEHEFRREHDARDAEGLLPPVEHRGNLVAGLESVRFGERLAGEDLPDRGAADEHAAGAEIEPVELEFAAVRAARG
jgi:hypothetical protein